jgi:cell division protein FtsN
MRIKITTKNNAQLQPVLRQQGNTLTGIIIGLVIGLSIAVLVAYMINKASSPFNNKNGKTDKADITPAQMQDPNKPMYGSKDAVTQAAKEVVTNATEASKAAQNENKIPEAKPVDVIAATASAAKVDVVDDKYIYFLQIGAFKDQLDAEASRAKLALIGIEASVSEKVADTGTLYRVRIGPFDHIEAMNKMRTKLSENSVDTAIVRTAK